MRLVPITIAARELGVTAQTLRNWEKQKKIQSIRTAGNHRRYDLEKLKEAFK